MRKKSALIFCFLVGCSVGHDYERPDYKLPEDWKEGKAFSQDVQTPENWWNHLNDPFLNKLVQNALRNNKDIQIAKSRLKKAQTFYQGSVSTLFPKLDFQIGARRGNLGYQTQNQIQDVYQSQLDASLDLDLFGGSRRRIEAQDAFVASAGYTLEGIQKEIISSLVQGYISLRESQYQRKIFKELTDIQKKLYDQTLAKHHLGAIDRDFVDTKRIEYERSVTQLLQIDKIINQIMYQLAVLMGEEIPPVVQTLRIPGEIPFFEKIPFINSPFQVMEQRADVQAAERMLAARTALTNAAISEMFPKINLSSLFPGYQSNSVIPSTQVWSIGVGAILPLFHFGQISSMIDAADADEQEAYQAFRKTILQAVADVEIKLSDYEKSRSQTNTSGKTFQQQKRLFQSVQSKYQNGLLSKEHVLQAQINLTQAEAQYVMAQAMETRAIAALQKALGR